MYLYFHLIPFKLKKLLGELKVVTRPSLYIKHIITAAVFSFIFVSSLLIFYLTRKIITENLKAMLASLVSISIGFVFPIKLNWDHSNTNTVLNGLVKLETKKNRDVQITVTKFKLKTLMWTSTVFIGSAEIYPFFFAAVSTINPSFPLNAYAIL